MRSVNTKSGFIIMLLLMACFSSCIPTKKVAYVDNQKKQPGKYTAANWMYKVQKGDRFFIKITDPLSNLSLGSGVSINTAIQANQGNIAFQQPTINDYVVNVDGTVDLPILGNVNIEGVGLDSLSIYLAKKCEGYISNPSVQVFMTNYNVTVLGEVRLPGFYQLITHRPNFFDAIGLAGDLTDFANRSEVQIQRKDGNGNVSVQYVDILDPLFISSEYYYIQPNDVIHISPLRVKKFSNENALPLILSTITTILTIFTIARTN